MGVRPYKEAETGEQAPSLLLWGSWVGGGERLSSKQGWLKEAIVTLVIPHGTYNAGCYNKYLSHY